MIVHILEAFLSLKLSFSFIPVEAHINVAVGDFWSSAMLGIVGIVFRVIARLVTHVT